MANNALAMATALIPFAALTFGIAGCASNSSLTASLTTINYRSLLKIERFDKTYYSGQYVGAEKYCFPPITNPICRRGRDESIYKPVAQLDMESFYISLTAVNSFNAKLMKDMVYLAAADMTLQRGYSQFTVLNDLGVDQCRSSYSADSYGTINNDSYRSTTVLNERATCAMSKAATVLLFRNKEDLTSGVLYRDNSSRSMSRYLVPEGSLYYGTSPNVTFEDYNKVGDGTTLFTPSNAWKTHYAAQGLSAALRAKYGIKDTTPYTFIDRRDQTRQEESDPLAACRT